DAPEPLTPLARSAATVPAPQRTSVGVTARRHQVLASPVVAKTLVFCWTKGPVGPTLNAGDEAAPVSTIPFALGSCPVHVSGTPCCLGAPVPVQPFPTSQLLTSHTPPASS